MTEPVIEWSEDKNRWLKAERGLSFEDVVTAIDEGRVLGDEAHHMPEKYGHQRILVVEIDSYACAVPYVVDGNRLFLKTIYRSHAHQRRYLEPEKSDE